MGTIDLLHGSAGGDGKYSNVPNRGAGSDRSDQDAITQRRAGDDSTRCGDNDNGARHVHRKPAPVPVFG